MIAALGGKRRFSDTDVERARPMRKLMCFSGGTPVFASARAACVTKAGTIAALLRRRGAGEAILAAVDSIVERSSGSVSCGWRQR